MIDSVKNNIFDYARHNCKFYYHLQNESLDILSFPIMTSKNYKLNIYSLLTQQYSGKALNALYKFKFTNNIGFIQFFYWNISDIIRCNVTLWKYRKKFYGITPNDKCVCSHKMTPYGYQINNNDDYIFSTNYLSIEYDFMKNMSQYNEMIKKYDPAWLSITSNMLIFLYEELQTTYVKCPLDLKFIEYWGDIIDDQLKLSMELYFNCKIAYLFGAEYLGVAYECEDGTLKIIEENAFVETYEGNIIISSKNNFCCPIIRYNTGYQGCITKTNGLILNKERKLGNNISPLVFIIESYIYEINKSNFNMIQQFSYKIVENEQLIISLSISEEYNSWKKQIIKRFKVKLKDFIDISQIDIIISEV